jgi:hypothetical protein
MRTDSTAVFSPILGLLQSMACRDRQVSIPLQFLSDFVRQQMLGEVIPGFLDYTLAAVRRKPGRSQHRLARQLLSTRRDSTRNSWNGGDHGTRNCGQRFACPRPQHCYPVVRVSSSRTSAFCSARMPSPILVQRDGRFGGGMGTRSSRTH